LLKGNLLNK